MKINGWGPRSLGLSVTAALWLTIATIVATIVACQRGPDSKPTSTPQPQAAATDDRPDVDYTYASKSEDGGETDGTDIDDGDAPPDEVDVLTPEAAIEAVTAAVDEHMDPYGGRLLTPALPLDWPLQSTTADQPKQVQYFVYPLEPLPKGVVAYRVGAATMRVQLDLTTKAATVEKLPKGKSLGRYEAGRDRGGTDPVHRAEAALFDVVRGDRPVKKVRYLLRRYTAWLDEHAVVAKDLAKRSTAFIEFVRQPP